MAQGAIGALTAYLENLKRVAKRNAQDWIDNPRDMDRVAAARTREDLTKQFDDPTNGLNFIAGPVGGLAGVIKSKGGNWLPGSVERALSGLKRDETLLGQIFEDANLAPQRAGNKALNKWVEGPLTKYVKTQMATPDDPVRALAEQGILHSVIDAPTEMYATKHRWAQGAPFGRSSKGISPLAQDWENTADITMRPVKASYFQRDPAKLENAPWIEKLSPDAEIYQMTDTPRRIDALGFGHLTDELRNALNPESGLPRNLQLTPEQMQQLGMEKAVRHVAGINEWRAAQKIAANQELANKVMAVREYAENNPKGLRWVELGKDTPELEKQLRYEGDTMGHCVGGYCRDVLEGRSRIFSLRDAKGEPHVTIETRPRQPRADMDVAYFANHVADKGMMDAMFAKMIRDGNGSVSDFNTAIKALPEYQEWVKGVEPDNIMQIKGKQNQAPNAEYIPFVQDFVKNSPIGQGWGDVGDLHNTGLMNLRGLYGPEHSGYVTREELRAYQQQHPDLKSVMEKELDRPDFNDGWEAEYAEGGYVTPHAVLNRLIDTYNGL